jgi:hypothetical protein
MSSLPRVTEATRERISRELDNLGPDVCRVEVSENLRSNNPELLDMAMKCSADIGNGEESMLGFCTFYRLLLAQASAGDECSREARTESLLDPLPRVTPQMRALVASRINEKGAEAFTRDSIEHLERNNPELLQLVHRFSARHADYLGTMQGFALLYACLVAQSAADRTYPH